MDFNYLPILTTETTGVGFEPSPPSGDEFSKGDSGLHYHWKSPFNISTQMKYP